ncbi:MAG: MarR family winged helix-turn-helix transcriptional regulator [Tumebacillaceae bacterium]
MANEVQSLFTRLFRRYAAEFRAKLDKDITGPQLTLLEMLRNYGSQKMTDLAERLCVTVGAVTLLGDRLIKAGYVERERSQSDRRVVQLTITQSGLELVEQFFQVRNEVLEKYLGRLNEDELEQLGHLFRKMLDLEANGTKS